MPIRHEIKQVTKLNVIRMDHKIIACVILCSVRQIDMINE
jgi:hypothetical protein